jgi:hypothetical protein
MIWYFPVWNSATAAWQHRAFVHAVWYPATSAGHIRASCSLIACHCIMVTARLHCPNNKTTGLWPDNSAATLHSYSSCYMGAAGRGCSDKLTVWHTNCMYVCTVTGSQTAYKRSVVTVMQWEDTKLHACMRIALLQWKDGSSVRPFVHAVWYPATVSDYRATMTAT